MQGLLSFICASVANVSAEARQYVRVSVTMPLATQYVSPYLSTPPSLLPLLSHVPRLAVPVLTGASVDSRHIKRVLSENFKKQTHEIPYKSAYAASSVQL